MASMVIRTVIIYILLNFSLRVMGKRQIGELDVGELVGTLLVSEIAAIPIDDTDIPLLNAIIPTLLLISLEIILSTLKNKSEKLKRRFEGEPVFIVYKGKLQQKALSENRISVNELLSELRIQGAPDISEVKYAVLEQNGNLSVITDTDTELAHSVIIDGEVIQKTLTGAGYDEKWLSKRLNEQKAKKEDILLMTVNDTGDINIIKKDGSF